MHILVVNDDGPPSRRLSPYIRPFVDTLQASGHLVSVAIPAASRSWIGKAHLIEASLKATYVTPDAFRDDGTWSSSSAEGSPSPYTITTDDGWAVIENGTPASCAQLGLYNLFPDRPPVDLLISGPNHGRNASTIYNLSSGTVGGALEAATCGTRGIAVSFGSKDEQAAETVHAAARLAVRVIEHLARDWDDRVELYNVNVPMRDDVEDRPVRYTRTLPASWSRGCLYAEVSEGKNTATPGGEGMNGHYVNGTGCNGVKAVNGVEAPSPFKERRFAWSAELSDLKKSLLAAGEGTDAHSVLNGCTSVTPLRANLWHIPQLDGDIRLG
ncbi:acid phosphatase [Aspergillus sp. HF37]|nr:acid phosphatase [Aspergillus sp. HF37]